MPEARVQELQSRIQTLSHQLIYRSEGAKVADDAIDVLVRGLFNQVPIPATPNPMEYNLSKAALSTTVLGKRVCGKVLCCLEACMDKMQRYRMLYSASALAGAY